jgi:hypothetical protein
MAFSIEFIACVMYGLHKNQNSNLGNCYYIILYYILLLYIILNYIILCFTQKSTFKFGKLLLYYIILYIIIYIVIIYIYIYIYIYVD